jgi:uncharacterized membrane protein
MLCDFSGDRAFDCQRKKVKIMYSSRWIGRATPALAALLLVACQADPGANDAEGANAEVAAPAPANFAETNTVATEPEAKPPTARYRFTGTEPFWGGTIDGATILYKTPEDQAGKIIVATVSKEGPTTRYSSTLDGQPFILKLTPGTCSDGMSDTVYPLHAVLAVHGEPRQGCANPIVGTSASSQTPPAAPAP